MLDLPLHLSVELFGQFVGRTRHLRIDSESPLPTLLCRCGSYAPDVERAAIAAAQGFTCQCIFRRERSRAAVDLEAGDTHPGLLSCKWQR